MAELLTVDEVEQILGHPFGDTVGRCHAVSLKIVKSGVLPGARVARGFCRGVPSQHSWVVVGDPYDDESPIVDATLWSYDRNTQGIYTGTLRDGRHRPHGYGSIFQWGKPCSGGGEPIELTPSFDLSAAALAFLDMLGPLDRVGWSLLSGAPVQEWPAGEIFAAMDDTPGLRALVPVDILGMTTDRNPGGLYLHEKETPS